MNAISTIEGSVVDCGQFTDWVERGRKLVAQRQEADWRLADWLSDGREQFGDQAGFDFLADALGIAPKRLKVVANVARSFPPALRDESLSVEHHAHVATLPSNEALTILKRAKAEHLTPEETRIEAVKVKAVIEQPALPGVEDDDPEYHELMAIVRAWNRARTDARETFADLMSECHLGLIEA